MKCVNKMLEIEYDTMRLKTVRYRLSITSEDPIFSANLANQIVEKYFVWHEKNRNLNFQNVKTYCQK